MEQLDKKIGKDIDYLKNTIKKPWPNWYLQNINSTTVEDIVFSSVHDIYTKTENMLATKPTDMFKMTKIIEIMLSKHNKIVVGFSGGKYWDRYGGYQMFLKISTIPVKESGGGRIG